MEQSITTKKADGILLSVSEAEEYHAFKKQKRVEEAKAAMQKAEAELGEEEWSAAGVKKLCESAKKINAAAVRVPSGYLPLALSALAGSSVKADCLVGSSGEEAAKVKAFEAKFALRQGAKEVTLVLSPSKLKEEKYPEIKKEIKKIAKKCRAALLKVSVNNEVSYSAVKRLSEIASLCGAKFLSVPYTVGSERLKKEVGDRLMLEFTGVKTVADYKILLTAGAERIGTNEGESIFSALLKEAEQAPLNGG